MSSNTTSETRFIKQIEEGLHSLSGEKAAAVVYSILCDHPRVTPEQLEDLSNKIGRHAHMVMRD